MVSQFFDLQHARPKELLWLREYAESSAAEQLSREVGYCVFFLK
jgi:hypothetical protein